MSVQPKPVRVMLTLTAKTVKVLTAVLVNKYIVYLQISPPPRSNKRPPPRPKYQASFPLPHHFSKYCSKDTKKTCFLCLLIYNF